MSHATVVQSIGATTTRTSLTVRAQLDTDLYPTGVPIGDEQMAQIHLQGDDFHGEWNYTITPSKAH